MGVGIIQVKSDKDSDSHVVGILYHKADCISSKTEVVNHDATIPGGYIVAVVANVAWDGCINWRTEANGSYTHHCYPMRLVVEMEMLLNACRTSLRALGTWDEGTWDVREVPTH